MIFQKVRVLFISIIILQASLAYSQETYEDILGRTYVPANQELYETIVSLDKKLFDAYNSCDMDTQTALYSEDLEFFHDRGGLSTSKEKVLIEELGEANYKIYQTIKQFSKLKKKIIIFRGEISVPGAGRKTNVNGPIMFFFCD